MIQPTNRAISSLANFCDKRLNLRFEKILNTLSKQVESTIPQAFKQWGQTKAVYRFLSNKKVTSDSILMAQLSSWTKNQLSENKMILAIHDTTTLDLTGKRSKEQLGCLSYENQRGFFLHNTLLCNEQGVPQTVFHQHYWGRDLDSLSKKKVRKHLPLEQKESGRWIVSFNQVRQHFKGFPSTRVVNICDREGDIYELLAREQQDNIHYIIRSCNNRKVEDTKEKLWEQLKNETVKGSYTIKVTDRQTLQKRMATITVKWLGDIILTPPYRKNKESQKPITVNMIYVQEINEPKGVKPINWKLLTSLEITSMENALSIINFYSYRWRIETFHYILKQGCKVESLQLEQEHNLKNAISLYSLMACRLLTMMYLSREKPNAKIADIGFTNNQYSHLCNYLEKSYRIKIDAHVKEQPTVESFTQLVGILGGYQKHNKGFPGIKVLWRGMKELLTILNCFNIIEEIRYG